MHLPGRRQQRPQILTDRWHQGYILLPVVLAICLVGGFAFFMNRQTGLYVHMTAGEANGERARYMAEAGLNHMIWHLQQANCAGYTDLIDIPFGTAHYSVTVTDEAGNPVTTGSPVVLTATATLTDGGSRTLVRRNVKIYSQSPIVLDLLPSKDASILQTAATTNYGADEYLTTSGLSTALKRSLLEFDLSAIPVATQIDSAQLKMYIWFWNGTLGNVRIRNVTNDWTEGNGGASGVTWNYRDKNGPLPWTVAGGDFDPSVTGGFAVNSADWYTANLTNHVQKWINGSTPNHGIILSSPANPTSVLAYYHSRESVSYASLRPILTVSYGRSECP
jgi:hypothetical protein